MVADFDVKEEHTAGLYVSFGTYSTIRMEYHELGHIHNFLLDPNEGIVLG